MNRTFEPRVWLLTLLSTIGTISLWGQDIHFSQFWNSPLNMNPALTGVFDEDVRFVGNYRKQWSTVPVDYLTFSGAADLKVYNPTTKTSPFAVGFLFNYDVAGDGDLSLLDLNLTGSYTWEINERHKITPGLMAGVSNQQFNRGQLLFESDYFKNGFDPDANTDYIPNRWYPDFSTGINWRFQIPDNSPVEQENEEGDYRKQEVQEEKCDVLPRSKRPKFLMDLGTGYYHLFEPDISLIDDGQERNLISRNNFYVLTTFKTSEKLDVSGNFMAQFQGDYREFLLGGYVTYYFNVEQYKEVAFEAGGLFRFNSFTDAIYPYVGFRYQR